MGRSALLLLVAVASPAYSQESATATAGRYWPQWLGPNRDGTTKEGIKPWTASPKVRGRAKVGEGHASPVVAAGKVFLQTKVSGKDEEQLTIFDSATGKEA